MSSTNRRCPIVRYISKGVVYDSWRDIPEKDWFIEEEKRVIVGYKEKRSWVPNPKYEIGFFDVPKMVKEPIYEWVKTGRWINEKRRGDHASITVYSLKTPEGKRAHRDCYQYSGKKEQKQLRHRRTRRKERNIIMDWVKGDLNKEIPIEKKHDLYDLC